MAQQKVFSSFCRNSPTWISATSSSTIVYKPSGKTARKRVANSLFGERPRLLPIHQEVPTAALHAGFPWIERTDERRPSRFIVD